MKSRLLYPRRRLWPLAAGIFMAANAAAVVQTYTFEAGLNNYAGFADTSIFDDSENAGGGTNGVFAGKNSSGGVRRALLRVDLSSLPHGLTVTSVTLHLHVSNAPNTDPPFNFELHRLLNSWGDGIAVAATGGGGNGAPAATGDATWSWNAFNNTQWSTPGGDYVGAASASADAGAPGTSVLWSGADLVADVQDWLNMPANNFGWILIGPESTDARFRKFDSSEAVSDRPRLVIAGDDGAVAPSMPLHTWPWLLVAVIIGIACIYRIKRFWPATHTGGEIENEQNP